jgi:hypothetical protein
MMNRWPVIAFVGGVTLLLSLGLCYWVRTSPAERITRDPPRWRVRGKDREWTQWKRRGL